MTPFNQPTQRLSPQTLLRQRYLILRLVGQGGMGAVYEARDTRAADRRVAVKEMRQANLDPQERVIAATRFQHEAALLGSLAHPNLPHFYESFSELGHFYLVMDFIEGQTLFQLLQASGGPLPVGQVLPYAVQLCNVLAYLHQHQPPIIFRDLKPANVMITERGQLFLIDFGIARLFKVDQKQDTTLLGSPGYAAPEQHGVSQTNPRSDLYSLGATLHHCLTARDPATRPNPFIFSSIRQDNPQVPAELEMLIQRLVAVDEQQRPASALEVREELLKISQQAMAPTERLVVPPSSHWHPGLLAEGQKPAIQAQATIVDPLAPSIAFGQTVYPSTAVQGSAASIWTMPFLAIFVLLFVLTVGGSVLAFNVVVGSDHLVEGSLALLLLLVALGAGAIRHSHLSLGILALTGLGAIIAGAAFFMQAVPGWQGWLINQLPGVSIQPLLNQWLAGGLLVAALGSLLWLAHPFSWDWRLLLLALFGTASVCVFVEYPADDGNVTKHVLLLVALVTLIQGLLLAAQMERIQQLRRRS
jgi:tRNA A-37 threonylcarbamoyl transferase component Bud32